MRRLFCLLGLSLVIVACAFPVQAQESGLLDGEDLTTNPKERPITVSATVLDNDPPTTPILISPGNNSFVNINRPTFTWEASSDANGIGHYELSRDGLILFNSIPTSDVDNADYTLTYIAGTDRYNLTPKTGWTEGSHTWKIRAVDTRDLGTDSATWTFTIDTQSPTFVITNIGELSTSISAQDSSTIPTTPLELTENQPLISGTGEASSTIQITLSIPDDPTQSFIITIAGGGTWSQQLGILPRDTVMSLDFVITDQAGNVSVLSGVEFQVLSEVIVIPAVSPSPTPELGSAEPSASPIPPIPGESPPITPGPSAFIIIPIIPPQELVNEVFQEMLERLPTPLANLIVSLPEDTKKIVMDTAEIIAPYSSLIATAAVPSLSIALIAAQIGQDFSLNFLLRLLQALGLLPKRRPQGLVFNSATNKPIAFATLTFTQVPDPANPLPSDTELITETVVTDVHGIYQGVKLPNGKYTLSVRHQDYVFPSKKTRASYQNVHDFYQGETFDIINNRQAQLFLIPIDPIESTESAGQTWRDTRRLLVEKFRMTNLLIPLFTFSLIMALFNPSQMNWTIVGLYLILMIKDMILSLKIPPLTGVVVEESGQPLPQSIVRLVATSPTSPGAIVTTNEKGLFSAFIDKDLYQITVTKPGYVWAKEGVTMSLEQIDARQAVEPQVIQMRNIEKLYSDLF